MHLAKHQVQSRQTTRGFQDHEAAFRLTLIPLRALGTGVSHRREPQRVQRSQALVAKFWVLRLLERWQRLLWARAIMEGFLEELQPGQREKIQTEDTGELELQTLPSPCLQLPYELSHL